MRVLVVMLVLMFASVAGAQPPTFDQLVARRLEGATALLRTHIDLHAGTSEVALRVVREERAVPIVVQSGPMTQATLATKGTTVAIAMARASPEPSIDLAFVCDGVTRNVHVTRPSSVPSGFTPATVLLTDTPDGFTLLWQEQNQTGDTAYTILARYGVEGLEQQAPTPVEIPWAMGAMVWNGHGYHLALLYGGAQPGQARICLVTLDPSGRPEQHPWWATRPIIVNELWLERSGDAVDLVYRDADAIYVHHSTAAGQWGVDPSPAPRIGRQRSGEATVIGSRDGRLTTTGIRWEP